MPWCRPAPVRRSRKNSRQPRIEILPAGRGRTPRCEGETATRERGRGTEAGSSFGAREGRRDGKQSGRRPNGTPERMRQRVAEADKAATQAQAGLQKAKGDLETQISNLQEQVRRSNKSVSPAPPSSSAATGQSTVPATKEELDWRLTTRHGPPSGNWLAPMQRGTWTRRTPPSTSHPSLCPTGAFDRRPRGARRDSARSWRTSTAGAAEEYGMTARAYYIRLRGKISGPFASDQLQALQRRGQLGRFHEVSGRSRELGHCLLDCRVVSIGRFFRRFRTRRWH